MGKAVLLALSLNQAVNIAWCCCGFDCLKPNEACSTCDGTDKHKSEDRCPCSKEGEGEQSPQRTCTHIGPGSHIVGAEVVNPPVDLVDVSAEIRQIATPAFSPPASTTVELCGISPSLSQINVLRC